jgi:hypothetical protein
LFSSTLLFLRIITWCLGTCKALLSAFVVGFLSLITDDLRESDESEGRAGDFSFRGIWLDGSTCTVSISSFLSVQPISCDLLLVVGNFELPHPYAINSTNCG